MTYDSTVSDTATAGAALPPGANYGGPGDTFAAFFLIMLALPVVPMNLAVAHLDLEPFKVACIFPCNLFCLLCFSWCALDPWDHPFHRTNASDSDEEIPQFSSEVLIPDSFSAADVYAMVLSLLLGILAVPITLAMVLFYVAPLLVIYIYSWSLPRPLKIVPRSCGFYVMTIFTVLLSLPLLLLSFSWVLVVRLVVWICCVPIGLLTCSRLQRSWSALRAYNGRPGTSGRSPADRLAQSYGYLWSPADLICAILGAMDRQGVLEFFFAVPLMLGVVPIYKHAVLCNAWIFDLREISIVQWCAPLELPKSRVQEGLLQMIAAARLEDAQRQQLDEFPFVAYHQYPPAERSSRTVAGMQFAENNPAPGTRITLLSHTSHPYDVPQYMPRSSAGEWSAIVVYLQSWNPWYHLAGEVEVNYRKDGGLEHAMWLVVDPNSKLAALALQSINELFEEVLGDVSEYLRQ